VGVQFAVHLYTGSLYKEMITVYYDNDMRPTDALCVQSVQVIVSTVLQMVQRTDWDLNAALCLPPCMLMEEQDYVVAHFHCVFSIEAVCLVVASFIQ
jgi:hypothetical protein